VKEQPAGPVFLIGFMASGKSSVGRALSSMLNAPFIDVDTEIERRENMPIHRIFESRGEACFRSLETDLLKELITAGSEELRIVATGGGLPCTGDNMVLMNSAGVTVYLKSSIDDIIARVGRIGERPVFQRAGGREGLKTLLQGRERYYARAHLTVENPNSSSPARTAEEVLRMLKTIRK
jgi:shikimate kinase